MPNKFYQSQNPNLMSQIAEQLAAGSKAGQAKYPTVVRTNKGPNKAYYDKLGADFGDRGGAAQAMSRAQQVFRKGGEMPLALAKLIEQSRKEGELPSQMPGMLEAREAKRLAGGAAAPKPDQGRFPQGGSSSMAAAQQQASQQVGPKGAAEAQAAQAIAGKGWSFKGTKAPMQEDIDLILNAEGADRAEGYNAFVKAFGKPAADAYLNDDGDE